MSLLGRILFVGDTILALTAGPAWATHPAAQTPESVPDSVCMRTWPPLLIGRRNSEATHQLAVTVRRMLLTACFPRLRA